MKIINKKYRFSLEIPNDFNELDSEHYSDFNIDESTLHLFIKEDENGPLTISINRDDYTIDEDDYLELVQANIDNMNKSNMRTTDHIHHKHGRRRIDVVYSKYKGCKYVSYFTTIHKLMIVCSIEIKEFDDESDKIVRGIFNSIEEE